MPLPGFVEDADLQTELEHMLKIAAGTLSSGDSAYVADSIHDGNVAAYQEIQARLLKRGLSQAQVDLWARGEEFQRCIGLYWCLIRNAELARQVDPPILKALDRRAELATVDLYDSGGNPITPPSPPSEGMVVTGPLSTSTDLFVMNPNDPRRGQVTRW